MKRFYHCGLYVSLSVSTDDCGYIFTTQNGVFSLDSNMVGVSSASTSHITIRGTVATIQLPVRKILLLGAPTFVEMLLTNKL